MQNYHANKPIPFVSVLCQAFNHSKFIEQCLSGILMQKTDFLVEVLVHDDASTDNTADIIREFEVRFPGVVKPIYQAVNQFSQNKKVFSRIQLPRANGKYVAICEGDDYWTDPFKLQKQVDFLEAHEDFAICHHNLNVIYDESTKESHFANSPDQKEVTTIEDLAYGNYIYTASCVFRNRLFDEFPDWFSKCTIADYPFHMLNARYGKIKYFPEVMAVYNVHKGGVWENKSEVYRCSKCVELIDHMKGHFDPVVNKKLIESQNRNSERLMFHFKDQPDKCKYYTQKILENDPLYALNLKIDNLLFAQKLAVINEELILKSTELNQSLDSLAQLNENHKRCKEELYRANSDRDNAMNTLREMQNSPVYRLMQAPRFRRFIICPLRLVIGLKRKFTIKKDSKLIAQSLLFDEKYYLAANPDVKDSGMPAVQHYLLHGGFEGRDPSVKFDSRFYLEQHKDVRENGINPLLHYILFGKKEGRIISPSSKSDIFK
jgi:glycosyltransferase involved in cell wall biosynthesis